MKIEICTFRTTCYVMGASELLMLEDHLPPGASDSLSITGATCLGLCRDRMLKPPFVKVNGKIISQATVGKILEALDSEITGADYAYDE